MKIRQVLFMAILLKVTRVDQSARPDLYQRISHIGGDAGEFQWKHTHTQAIQSIERGLFHYYVEKDSRPFKLEVGIAPNGCKYLRTQADGQQPELLLNLSESPQPEPR